MHKLDAVDPINECWSVMDIGQIETFLAIARLGSFSRAAEKLHRSQPAISRRLALLESEIGAPLFERVRKRVQLTDVGRALRPHAESILASTTDGYAAAREQLTQGVGSVALSVVGTLVDRSLADVIARFANDSQRARVTITTTSSVAVSDHVREGAASLGLRYFLDYGADLECEQIGWEKMVVVSAKRSPRINTRTPREGLATRRWIGFSASKLNKEGFGPLLIQRLAEAKVSNPDIMFVDSLSAQKRLVEAGLGLGFLPFSSVKRELHDGSLALVRLPRLATRIPIILVNRRGGYLSPAARDFKSALKRHWSSVVTA